MMPSTVSAEKQRAMAAVRASSSPGPGSSCRSSSTGSTGSASARAAGSRRSAGGDAVRHQPQPVGIGPADGAPGQRQIHADLVRHAREGPAHAVVGEQADAGLGHGEAVALAGDPVRAVEGDADARAHHHAVDQRDGRLGEALEQPVERIFGGQRLTASALRLRPHRRFRGRRRRRRRRARRRRRSRRHRSGDRAPSAGRRRPWRGAHGSGEGVERGGPVQRDEPGGAPCRDDVATRACRAVSRPSNAARPALSTFSSSTGCSRCLPATSGFSGRPQFLSYI